MIYLFADCELDTTLFELRKRGAHVALEPQAYDLLAYLLGHRDRVVTKVELLDQLWADRFVSDGAITHCVMLARKAVGDAGSVQRVIKTIHRRGYRFIAPVIEVAREPRAREGARGASESYAESSEDPHESSARASIARSAGRRARPSTSKRERLAIEGSQVAGPG